jgi:hypothetical protein
MTESRSPLPPWLSRADLSPSDPTSATSIGHGGCVCRPPVVGWAINLARICSDGSTSINRGNIDQQRNKGQIEHLFDPYLNMATFWFFRLMTGRLKIKWALHPHIQGISARGAHSPNRDTQLFDDSRCQHYGWFANLDHNVPKLLGSAFWYRYSNCDKDESFSRRRCLYFIFLISSYV